MAGDVTQQIKSVVLATAPPKRTSSNRCEALRRPSWYSKKKESTSISHRQVTFGNITLQSNMQDLSGKIYATLITRGKVLLIRLVHRCITPHTVLPSLD